VIQHLFKSNLQGTNSYIILRREKKMNSLENRQILSAFLILIFAVSTVLIAVPIVNAAVVQVESVIFVSLAPNPVGVGQPVLVSFQMDKLNPLAVGVAQGDHFAGYMVQITKPDGITESKGPYTAFATSGYIFFYTPTQTGNYIFTVSFPGQWANTSSNFVVTATVPFAPNTQYYFKPATGTATLTVQSQQIQSYPDNPLPTGYWTTPINSENKNWNTLADNWLMEGYNYRGRRFPGFTAVASYASAPNTAHVLWSRQLWFGGEAGGQFGDQSFYTGLSYEQPYLPLILQGRIIYSEHTPVASTITSKIGTRCLDLYTGEEVWFLNNIVIDFLQVLSWDSPNEHGLLAHLWTQSGTAANTTYNIYDGSTGTYQFTITNATSGSTTYGPKGEILSYAITGSGVNQRLILWNSTKAILDSGAGGTAPPRQDEYYSPPRGVVADGRFGIQFNVSMSSIPGAIKHVNLADGVLITQLTDATTFPFTYVQAGFDVWTGQLLWAKNRTDNYGHYAPSRLPYSQSGSRNGIFVMIDDTKSKLNAYDVHTGNQLWSSDIFINGWSYFDQVVDIAYNKVYLAGYDGHVRAYDATNGQLKWDFFDGNAGYETAYDTWPIYGGFTIADHKLFVTNDDHSPDSVIWRGGKLYAIDTETGKNVWNISGWLRIPAVSNGYLTAENSLDGKIYTFGKGPSVVTVSAPQAAVTIGAPVMISGTITDQSPGSTGTPCISDLDMSAWMQYLYMQKPMPTTASGVPVKVTATFPDGHSEVIGTAISDIGGSYGLAWTPTVECTYQIKVAFEGTNSYGSSYATAYLVAGSANAVVTPTIAPTATVAPTAAPSSSATISASPTVVPTPGTGVSTETLLIAGAAVVIIIAVVAAALVLRKRK
jgi:outer membrane protein assembly factor BamB